MNGSLAERFKIVRGPTNCETALSGVSVLPASGSFIDVSGYEFVHIIAHVGAVHASDEPVLTPKCSDAANGTADTISSALAATVAADDDGQMLVWSIEVRKLPTDHHFVALGISGTVTNGSYCDVIFLLEKGSQPVTQVAAQIPADQATSFVYLG